jgi:hypothetical protein
MSGMKVNLKGLIENAGSAAKRGDKMYGGVHAYALKELHDHIVGLVNGKHTIEEFADHYCIERKIGDG